MTLLALLIVSLVILLAAFAATQGGVPARWAWLAAAVVILILLLVTVF